MFTVGLIGGGDSNPRNIECDIVQLIKLFPIAKYQGEFEETRRKYSCVPPGADPDKYRRIKIREVMDPITKK